MNLAALATLASFLLLLAATGVLGTRYGTRVGVAAAVVTASSALELLRLSYPPSTLLADAFGVTALAAATGTRKRAELVAAVAAAVALFLMPSTTPTAVVIALFLLYRPERPWPVRLRAASVFAVGCAGGLLLSRLIPAAAPGAGGVGFALIGLPGSLVLVTFLLLFLAAPFLLPGMLTALLMMASLVDVGSRVFIGTAGNVELPSFLVIAVVAVLVMASVDAMWRRRHLPRPDVAVALAAGAVIVLEHV